MIVRGSENLAFELVGLWEGESKSPRGSDNIGIADSDHAIGESKLIGEREKSTHLCEQRALPRWVAGLAFPSRSPIM